MQNVLGDIAKGHLRLWEDDKGLAFHIDSLPTTAAADAAKAVNGSDVGMSFGFVCGKDAWSRTADGSRLRVISDFADMDDISIVVDGAYRSSDVNVAKRSLEAWSREQGAVEKGGKGEREKGSSSQVSLSPSLPFSPSSVERREAVPFKATPTDDADTWDGAAAEKRVREWATAGEGKDKKVDFAKYRQAFAYQTGDGTKLGDFHLQHHDVKAGKLVVVWRGLTAAMAAVNGSRGGVKWEKAADKEPVYEHLKKHYEQFKQDPPELRSLPANSPLSRKANAMSIELLERELELKELEFRGFGPCMVADASEQPQAAGLASDAHRATRHAFEAKREQRGPLAGPGTHGRGEARRRVRCGDQGKAAGDGEVSPGGGRAASRGCRRRLCQRVYLQRHRLQEPGEREKGRKGA